MRWLPEHQLCHADRFVRVDQTLDVGGTTYSDPMPELEAMIDDAYQRLGQAERRMSDEAYRQAVAAWTG